MYRMIGAGVLTALLALTATACSPTDVLPPMEAVQAAAAQVEEEETFAFELELSMDQEDGEDSDSGGFGSLFGDGMTMNAEGRFDLANDRSQFAADLVLIEMETIIDGDVCYIRSNWTGDKWMREEPCEDAVVMEADEDSPIGDPISAPAEFVRSLEEHAESVEEVGEAEVRGETTRHMRLVMSGPEFEEYLEDEELVVDVYIDGDGRIARLATEFASMDEGMTGMAEEGGSGLTTVTMQMDLFDYGEPVELDIPSDDEIADEDEMMDSGGFEFDSEDMD